MSKRLLYFLFLISYALHGQQFRNLIIFIGNDGNKNFEIENPKALSQELALAIISQSAPILIQKQLYAELMGFKFKGYDDIDKKSEKFALLEYMKRNNEIDNQDANDNFFDTYVYYQLPLMHDDWYLLDCCNTSFLLLLPKKYLEKTLGYRNLQYSESEERTLGLNLTETLLLPLPQSNDKQVTKKLYEIVFNEYLKDKPLTFNQSDVEQIIKRPPLNQETQEPVYAWNIVCSGHGLPETKMIGVSIKDFKKLLTFFDSINTNLVYYSTCFGGAQQLQRLLNDSKGFNFDLISSTALDATNRVDLESKNNWTISNVFMPEPELHFDQFFQAIEANKSLEQIGALLAGRFVKTHNILGICQRNNTHFVPGSVDPDVKMVTHTNHSVAAIKQEPITIDNNQIGVIYPAVLSVPVHVDSEKDCRLVFMADKQGGKTDIAHYFPSLKITDKEKFLKRTIVHDFEYAYPRTLFVKELHFLKKRKLINDVVFKIPKSIKNENSIRIFVKNAGNLYYRTSNFEDQSSMTVDDCIDLLNTDDYFKKYDQILHENQLQTRTVTKCLDKFKSNK